MSHLHISVYSVYYRIIGISETRDDPQKERESAHMAINERFEGVGVRFSLRASDVKP